MSLLVDHLRRLLALTLLLASPAFVGPWAIGPIGAPAVPVVVPGGDGSLPHDTSTPSAGVTFYQYYADTWNRSLETITPTGGTAVSTSFVWDGAGQMLSSTRAGLTTNYLAHGGAALAENTSGTTTTYAKDIQGNVIGLIATATQTGDPRFGFPVAVRKLSYDAFRNPVEKFRQWDGSTVAYIPASTLTTGNRGLGMWFEGGATGMYKTPTRFYQPSIGRFTTRDPLGHRGSPNLYGWPTDPIQYHDASGLEWELSYAIEGDASPLFTFQHDGVRIGARWIPEPGMPSAPNPQGWKEEFEAAAGAIDAVLQATPDGSLRMPDNHPVSGFNRFDFAAADAYSFGDVGGFLFTGGEGSHHYLHRKDREWELGGFGRPRC